MSMPQFPASDRQREIYLNGFAGIRSSIPLDWRMLEEKARKHMSVEAFAYIAGGAGLESTIASNRSSFDSYRIVPRMLRDVSQKSTGIELFGQKITSPLFFSPVGLLAWLLNT